MENISRTVSRSSWSLAPLAAIFALGLAACGVSPDEENGDESADPAANVATASPEDMSIDSETDVQLQGLGGRCLKANDGKKVCIKGVMYGCGCTNPTHDYNNPRAWRCYWARFNPKYYPQTAAYCRAKADHPH